MPLTSEKITIFFLNYKPLTSFFDSVNDLLKIHAPYKKVKKHKLKFKEKPWISSGLKKSISIKNSIFKKYINKKDPHIKEELHQKYKNYRNTTATLMKKVNKITLQNILKLISKTLKTHGRELKASYH